MMDQGKKYLSDILEAIKLIETFTDNIEDFNIYTGDLKTQSAVERQLGIIGEAINRFEKLFPDSSLKYSRKIIGLRNRIIHAYDGIDSAIIWVVIKNHLPLLKYEVIAKLKD